MECQANLPALLFCLFLILLLLPVRLLFRLEVKRSRVHAVAKPGRLRAIRKHVTQVRIALGATSLDPGHAVTGVSDFLDVLAVGSGVKTRPPRARIKFRIRAE